MTTLLESPGAPAAPADLALLPVAPGLWRVLDRAGRALGHLDAYDEDGARRYRARRFQAASAAFRVVGEFWTAAEALECLRHHR